MMCRYGSCIFARVLTAALVGLVATAIGQAPDDGDREDAAIRRFQSVLEKAPRRGTALDRLYGHHVERGTLDGLVDSYRKKAEANSKDGVSRMLVGMLEAQRGHDAAAVAALREAESARPDDALAPYYLGQSLVLVGRPDEAVEAFERALVRKPTRADLLEIYQALGRVHQRARRADKALEVWARLEKQFPDDPRVAEQIAGTLAEEGQSTEALPRYEALAAKARDPYRRVQFRIEAAELKVRLNRPKDALADFEGLLAGLNPESWLYKEVRRKVEEVFLRNDDTSGLASYYDAWVKAHPDDLDAIARQSRVLANLGRTAEARAALEQAVKLAPTRRELRLALVEQLVNERKFGEAAAQYEVISKADPNNPDNLREWGRLLLRDPDRPEADRRAAASAVWRRLLDARPKDPGVAAQVADLFRRAEMTDDALALYQKAVELAPESPQYREYLGEYYHSLKRPDDALAAWSAMAAGANRNAANLGRLAEVLSGFGYKVEAERASAGAVDLDPKGFDLRLKHADLLAGLDRLDDALAELEAAAPLAVDAESAEAVLAAELKVLQSSGKLAARIDALKADLDAGRAGPGPDGWRRLARLDEAAGRLADATTAVRKALEIDPKSVPSWVAAARIAESSGDLGGAADSFRKLADIDRRARTEHLTAIARLESRLGRREEALAAGRELLAAAPNNPEHYGFYAELCFGLGENDEGLKALRRASQLNEADPKAALTLAEALAGQFRTDEAIEIYWRAFDKATDMDGKVGVVAKLAPLYLQQNAFDRLLARLERAFGQEAVGGGNADAAEAAPREKAACLAQAFASSGDYAAARGQLEGLLAANSRDTQLLGQLSKLAEEEGDIASAARYQKQIIDAAPSFEGKVRLAQMYLRAGESAESEAVWASLAADEEEAHRVLQAVDSLLTASKHEAVLAITEKLLRKEPGNWDALYREGSALVALDRPEEAARRFRAILALRGDDDEPDGITRARKKAAGGRPTGARAATTTASAAGTVMFPIRMRTTMAIQIRRYLGLDSQFNQAGNSWYPADFGQARMGAMGMLLNLAQKANTHEALVTEFRATAEADAVDARARWDWFYFTLMQNQSADAFDAARRLARSAPNDATSNWTVLFALPSSRPGAPNIGYSPNVTNPRTGPDRTPPLPAATIDEVLAAYRTVQGREPGWIYSTMLVALQDELKRAGRQDDIDRIATEYIARASDASSYIESLTLLRERTDIDGFLAMVEKIRRSSGSQPALQAASLEQRLAMATSDFLQALAEKKRYADVLRFVDATLDAVRRPERVAQRVKERSSAGGSSIPGTQAARGLSLIIRQGQSARQVMIDFPTPNAYLDGPTIVALRGAYEAYRRDDLASDLAAHLRDRLAAKAQDDPVYERMALASLRWWNDEKDEAVADWEAAVASVGKDPDLVLSLAELRASRNESTEALALADSIEPSDQKQMQRRELLALRLAVLNGNVDRARRAAERLFGLRLDSNTQIQLAAQMHQLGMHELAEAVLGRARRRAGADTNALVALMLQYQRQDKLDQAIQVAHQILRKAPQQIRTNTVALTATDPSQQQALQLLAVSGKLNELIERAEAQLARSPGSLNLYQSLAAYYGAANKRDKVKEVAEKIVALRPEDARLRFSLAQQAQNSGDNAGAIEHYRVAIKKEPALFGQQYYNVLNAYRQAGKMDDLYKLVGEVDVRALGGTNPYGVVNLVQQLMMEPKSRDLALDLFRKSWKAFPNYRQQFLTNFGSDELMKLPEMYDYLREALLPPASQSAPAPWAAVEMITSYQGDGRIDAPALRILDIAAGQGRLGDIGGEIDAALERHPEWSAGRALRALVRLRQGETDEASSALKAMIEDKDDPIPTAAALVIGQELDAFPEAAPLALALYDRAVTAPKTGRGIVDEYEYSPARRLAEAHRRAGHPELARTLILKYGKDPGTSTSDASYTAYQKLNSAMTQGRALISLGYPTDAARLYSEALADPAAIQMAMQMYGGTTPDQFTPQLRNGLDQAMRGLRGESLAQTVRGLIHPEGVAPPYGQKLDLVLLVQPRDLRKAEVTSLLATALLASKETPDLIAEAAAALDALAAEHPDDFSVAIASAAAALASGREEAIASAVARLAKLAEANPLETLAPGQRPNTRQREAAARQLGLWTIARECVRREATRDAATLLAVRAQEAARRQADPIWIQAMLRESGQFALDRGDRPAAQAAWSELLELIQAAPAATPVAAIPGRPLTKGAAPATATPAARPGSPAPAGMTLERFRQSGDVARLAAENGLADLSLRAVRDALRGGPPVTPMDIAGNARSVRMVSSGLNMPESPQAGNFAAVFDLIETLDPLWARAGTDPTAVAEMLAEAVAPSARPKEIFPYPRPLAQGLSDDPKSVAAVAARWAVKAGKADDLRQRIEARRESPLAELAARVLLVRLALASGDRDAARTELDALAIRLAKDSLQATAETACHAALPALAVEGLADAAEAVLSRAAKTLATPTPAGVPAIGGDLTLLLARHYHKAGRPAEASALLDSYQSQAAVPSMNARVVQSARLPAARVAAEYARAGRPVETLKALGGYADASALLGNEPPLGPTLASLARLLAARPPAERYELLRSWTMPAEGRRSVRSLAAGVAEDVPAPGGIVATPNLLIVAAREAGQLDALAVEAEHAAGVAEPIDGAASFLALVRIAQGRPDDARAALADALKRQTALASRPSNPNIPPTTGPPNPWPDALLALAALEAEPLRGPARSLAEAMLPGNPGEQGIVGECLRLALAADTARRAGSAPPPATDLAHWLATSSRSESSRSFGLASGRWASADGHVRRIAGHQADALVLAYPLAGTFAVEADVLVGPEGVAGPIGYGGWKLDASTTPRSVLDPSRRQYRIVTGPRLVSPGSQESLDRDPVPVANDAFNALRIEVEPGKVRYKVNGRLVHEETASPAVAPWLSLHAGGPAEFRRLRVEGRPAIPREVRLVVDDDLRGWVGTRFGDSIRPRAAAEKAMAPASELSFDEDGNPMRSNLRDWSASDGVLTGERREGRATNPNRNLPTVAPSLADDPMPSLLTYVRPLRDGEAFSYEFLYEPGVTEVHPALGRSAFLVGPEGIRVHPLFEDPATESVADATPAVVGVMPLRPGAWNRLTLRLDGGRAVVVLNDVTVLERPLAPDADDRTFGLFHFKDRSAAKVRDVVLRGGWPDELPADVLAPADPATHRARLALVGEAAFGRDASRVLDDARELPADRRAEALATWVLPTADRASPRLQGVFRPGGIEAPALAMIAAAREAGTLDALAARIEALASADDPARRGRLALLVAANAALGKEAETAADLEALRALAADLPASTPPADRWPELIATTAALGSRADAAAVRPLAEAIDDQARRLVEAESMVDDPRMNLLARSGRGASTPPKPITARQSWAAWAARLRARLDGPADADLGRPPAVWLADPQETAASRAFGLPGATWAALGDRLIRRPGQGGGLYLGVPLRGDFALTGTLAGLGDAQVRPTYAGISATVAADGASAQVVLPGRPPKTAEIRPPVDPKAGPFPFRLAVAAGTLRIEVAGRTMVEEPLPRAFDPTLILAPPTGGRGEVSGLKLSGRPEIPDAVSLADRPDLAGWHESGPGTGGWQKRGAEIVGARGDQRLGSDSDSLLVLDRPIGPGESLAYEFYYEPGRSIVHPVLGRRAFLIGADGIRPRSLDDGVASSRAAADPGTSLADRAPRRDSGALPLKEREWNRLTLALKGDVLTISLNGVAVEERPLDLSQDSDLTFGLLHDSEHAEARVRRLSVSGPWAEKLGDLTRE